MVELGLSMTRLVVIDMGDEENEEWKMLSAMKAMPINVEMKRKMMMVLVEKDVCFWWWMAVVAIERVWYDVKCVWHFDLLLLF
jgi:hypothetical protein